MKIVFTTDTITRGGKERQLFLLAHELIKKKWDVNIVTLKYTSENYISEYALDDKIIIKIGSASITKQLKEFNSIIYNLKANIVFSWDLKTSILALVNKGRNNYIFINGSIQHGIRLLNSYQLLRSFICWISPYNIANSYAGLAANNLKYGKRNYILYNGIENKFIKPSASEKNELREKLLPKIQHTKIFISVANFVPYKDYFTVLKALKLYKLKESFFYIIVGEGYMRQEIEHLIKDYGLENNVLLTGQIENVNDYLFISDIMIHSSRGEGISNAILEGIFAGLPIIATNVGGIPETVFPQNSLLFTYKDEQDLYNCLIKSKDYFKTTITETEEYKEHLNKFSVYNMVSNFISIIEDITRQKSI